MKAISIRQPWAHAILHWGKDVENRGWYTKYRGPLLIHASTAVPPRDTVQYLSRERGFRRTRTAQASVWFDGLEITDDYLRQLPRGCLIGVVDVYDCVEDSDSSWAARECWHWLLRNPRSCRPVACPGVLRLWTPPPPLVKQLPAWAQKRAARSWPSVSLEERMSGVTVIEL